MNLPVRKHPRLKMFDYKQCGCYHITICTKNRRPVLSRVIPSSDISVRAAVRLSKTGQTVDRYIQNIPCTYSGICLEKYVVMPNHVHLLLLLSDESSVSIPTVIRSLKRMVTKELGYSIWQDSYYDVVIRNDAMFRCEWAYIDNNPDKWAEDTLYVEQTEMW